MSQQSTDLYDQLDALHAVTELTKAAAQHGAVRVPLWRFYTTRPTSATIDLDSAPKPSDTDPWLLAFGQAVSVTHLPFQHNHRWMMLDTMRVTYMGVPIEFSLSYPCTAEQAEQVRS